MKKRGLSDIKRRNRQVILQLILEHEKLSRIEIAQMSSLAASTVSSLTGELLEDGILIEAGVVTTAGRSRTVLSLNPDYGSIIIIDIGHKQISMHCFDILLHPLKTAVLSRWYCCGNELAELIDSAIRQIRDQLPPLRQIGLLFQEDMRESDFRVMYSTGFSSASITLREALISAFRIPVEEQYSVSYTITNALCSERPDAVSSNAHISLGARVMVSVTLDGKAVPIRDSFYEDMAAAWKQEIPIVEMENTEFPEYLGNLLVLLCTMFQLNTIFISGTMSFSDADREIIRTALLQRIPDSQLPHLKYLRINKAPDVTALMAQKLVQSVILAT